MRGESGCADREKKEKSNRGCLSGYCYMTYCSRIMTMVLVLVIHLLDLVVHLLHSVLSCPRYSQTSFKLIL